MKQKEKWYESWEVAKLALFSYLGFSLLFLIAVIAEFTAGRPVGFSVVILSAVWLFATILCGVYLTWLRYRDAKRLIAEIEKIKQD